MTAKAINAIMITADETRDGIRVLTTPCDDYETYQRLPSAVDHDGARFGLTGWNSDRLQAYYRSDARTDQAARSTFSQLVDRAIPMVRMQAARAGDHVSQALCHRAARRVLRADGEASPPESLWRPLGSAIKDAIDYDDLCETVEEEAARLTDCTP